jgi:MFS family permease
MVSQTYVSDVTGEVTRTKSLGYLSMAMGVGFIVGPSVGGLLQSIYGFRLPCMISSLLFAFDFVLVYFFLPDSTVQKSRKVSKNSNFESLLNSLKDPILKNLLILSLLSSLVIFFIY